MDTTSNAENIPEDAIFFRDHEDFNNVAFDFECQNRERIESILKTLSEKHQLAPGHTAYLHHLKTNLGFNPKVIYDIGSCILHWTREAQKVWPDAEIILFDAFKPAQFLYGTHRHWVGCLSNKSFEKRRFYQNNVLPGGNSYYREATPNNEYLFPKFIEMETMTLDDVVSLKNFPPPDLIKMDVQGAELDVLMGATETLKSPQLLIAELQKVHYNEGAPLQDEVQMYLKTQGWQILDALFCDNGPDGDFSFRRVDAL